MLNAMLIAGALTSSPPTLSVDFMVGKWSAFREDCSHTIKLKRDGTVRDSDPHGKWKVGEGKLTFDYGDVTNRGGASPRCADRGRRRRRHCG